MTGSAELLEAMPRHQTAHAALLHDIIDILRGAAVAPQEMPPAGAEQLSPSELRVLRYLPTNLSRPEIASELSVSVNTVNTHIRNIYAKLQATDRSSAVRRARGMRLLAAGLTTEPAHRPGPDGSPQRYFCSISWRRRRSRTRRSPDPGSRESARRWQRPARSA